MKFVPISLIANILLFNLANAASVDLEVVHDRTYLEDEMASMCNEALMHGNLMKIKGDVWDSGNGNLEFISFHKGRVFNFFGYSHDLLCSVTINGAGVIQKQESHSSFRQKALDTLK